MAGFRDRFFSPKVARAILSPSGMLLAGGAAAATILVGGGLLAVPAALVAWGARVFAAIPRGKQNPRIDAYGLSEPWRTYVLGAQSAKLRFDRTVKGTSPGPIRDRLAGLSDRLDAGIEDCWRVAQRGDDIDEALNNLSTAEAQVDLARLRRQLGGQPATGATAATIQSLEAQLQSAARMQAVSKDANDRLGLLNARLDELVAKGVEVSVGAADGGWLSDEVDGVVSELESLRLALEDTNAAAGRRPNGYGVAPAADAPPAVLPPPTTEPGAQTSPPTT